MFPSASSTSSRTGSATLGRLLYETRLPGPNRRLVWDATKRVFVSTLASMVLAALLVYFFPSAALAVPVPGVAILWSVRTIQDRRLSIALLLLIFGAALWIVSALFILVLAPQLGLDPGAYPGLTLFSLLVSGVPSGLMTLIGGGLLLAQYRRSSLHLALYEQGVALDQLRSHRTYSWDEIASVSRQERGQQSVYVIRPKHRRSFVFTERFRDGRHIGEVLLKVFANSKLPG